MKKLIIALSLALSFAVVAAASASGGGTLYAAKCAGCHGADGAKAALSRPLKGMSAAQAAKALNGYKAKTYGGKRKAVMERIAARLSGADVKALSAHIAKF